MFFKDQNSAYEKGLDIFKVFLNSQISSVYCTQLAHDTGWQKSGKEGHKPRWGEAREGDLSARAGPPVQQGSLEKQSGKPPSGSLLPSGVKLQY